MHLFYYPGIAFLNFIFATRCIFTNINPANGERNPNFEPLKTLKKSGICIPDQPVMGIHLGLRAPGSVCIGDSVYVEDTN